LLVEQPTLPFDVTASKHRGNLNSQAANLRLLPHKASMRERIRIFVAACDFRGATVKEIAEAFGKQLHQISGRISEGKLAGELFDSGRDRDGCSVLVSRREWVTPNVR
jgi:hypothetical protein